MKYFIIGLTYLCIITSVKAHENMTLKISDFTVEINNKEIAVDKIIDDIIVDLEPKTIIIFQNDELTYQVEFLFKRSGNRIKVKRRSTVLMPDGGAISGNSKKEVQFMSSSAPGNFEFPVAENIVLDKNTYSTFFISYRVQVKYS